MDRLKTVGDVPVEFDDEKIAGKISTGCGDASHKSTGDRPVAVVRTEFGSS